ncbi:CU044_5270 family protein [Actinoplanes sp. NPDC048988]|uniref:CU044_5270 family protein n=1 Tax=Actinoplanes sp. NPDC048988 TaxID=3363901 RepID=UPI00371843BA
MIDELDEALHDLYPVPGEDAGALRRVRTRVLAEIEERPADRRRRWPRLPLAVAAVLVAVAVVAMALRGSAPPVAMVEVAQTLNTAADAQTRALDGPIPAGSYRYIATHSLHAAYNPGVAGLFGTREETWVPADPSAQWFLLRTDTGERTRLLGTDEQVKGSGLDARSSPERLSGRCGNFYPAAGDPCAAPGNWQSPTAAFLAELPRDPRRLYDRLRTDTKGHGQDRDQEVLVYVTDALRSGLIPADLRAALYRALTYLPPLEISERRVTLDGRAGTALGITAAGKQQEIVIDPVTGAFIGERKRLTEDQDGVPAGTVVGSSTVRYAIVGKPWQRPAS